MSPDHDLVRPLDALFRAWRRATPLAEQCIETLRSSAHGDLPRWLRTLGELPAATPSRASFDATVVIGRRCDLTQTQVRRLATTLRALKPWRKGPFELFGVRIDAEWRSDRKWARIAPHIDLSGARVLDVGCGNGYYGWRMLAAGARSVIGLDPSLLFVVQHAAVAHYLGLGGSRNLVLPLRLEDVSPAMSFDVVFSMGVIYHRRDPAQHLRDLARHADRDATLVLESLIVDGATLVPKGRYARMRNVYVVPNVETLRSWLADAGFANAVVVDTAVTTSDEQRTTDWMPFHSLADALHDADLSRTVEGYPAPTRAVIIARP